MSADLLIESLVGMLRRQFYPDRSQAKAFFQQRTMLLRAVLYLASWLKERGVWLKEDRYRQILMEIVQGIKQHGATAEIRNFGAYFLHAVQEHVKIHGDRYYQEGKSIRNAVDQALSTLPKAQASDPEAFIDQLAQAAALLKAGAPKRKPSTARRKPDKQMGLL